MLAPDKGAVWSIITKNQECPDRHSPKLGQLTVSISAWFIATTYSGCDRIRDTEFTT